MSPTWPGAQEYIAHIDFREMREERKWNIYLQTKSYFEVGLTFRCSAITAGAGNSIYS